MYIIEKGDACKKTSRSFEVETVKVALCYTVSICSEPELFV